MKTAQLTVIALAFAPLLAVALPQPQPAPGPVPAPAPAPVPDPNPRRSGGRWPEAKMGSPPPFPSPPTDKSAARAKPGLPAGRSKTSNTSAAATLSVAANPKASQPSAEAPPPCTPLSPGPSTQQTEDRFLAYSQDLLVKKDIVASSRFIADVYVVSREPPRRLSESRTEATG